MKTILALSALTILLVFAYFFDVSELTHQVKILPLVDKWHEESCSPIYSDGNYIGESCSDDWTFVVIEDQLRETKQVSGHIFKSFVPGDTLKLEFDKGKLGFVHNKKWSKI